MEKCQKCGAPEVDWNGPATHYKCGSSDYDQRPGTFKQSIACAKAEARAEALKDAADRGWQALKKTGCHLGITYSAFYEEVTGEKYNPLG
jgi:hypothetical protein